MIQRLLDRERSVLPGAYNLEDHQDLPSDARISVDPPSSPNTRLAVEYPELVEAKLLLQLTSHSNAGCACTDNDDGIVGVRIVLVAINSSNSICDHLDVVERYES